MVCTSARPRRVTFDSNVWERVVFPHRHPKDPNYICLRTIKEALRDGRLQSFICEVFATLEAISRGTRPTYFGNIKPKVDLQTETHGKGICLNITIGTPHNRHPGLNKKLEEKMHEARAVGMRLLSAPRLNLPLPACFLDDPTLYDPQVFGSAEYAERFGDAAAAIEARGVGGGAIAAIVKRIKERLPANTQGSRLGSQLLQYAKDEAEKIEIEKAIAEWADGDLVASHIASENDLLCTEDQAKTAGGPSVFNATNRAWLRTTYGIEFVTVPELAVLLGK